MNPFDPPPRLSDLFTPTVAGTIRRRRLLRAAFGIGVWLLIAVVILGWFGTLAMILVGAWGHG